MYNLQQVRLELELTKSVYGIVNSTLHILEAGGKGSWHGDGTLSTLDSVSSKLRFHIEYLKTALPNDGD